MTPKEFLDWEAISPIRHEYRQGEVWAMSGASAGHGALTSDLHLLIGAHFRGRGFRIF